MSKNLSEDDISLIRAILARAVRSSGLYHEEKPETKRKDNKESENAMLSRALSRFSDKYAEDASRPVPSDADLRRMYDVVQADANLTKRIAGLGFGNKGDAYRRAAIKLRIMAIMNVLRDGKNIRNDIVHRPGYIPSEQSTSRAIQEYRLADEGISDFLRQGY